MKNEFVDYRSSAATDYLVPDLAADTLKGLTANSKFLLPKYFYDKRGSELFSDITRLPEYYLTSCELEIFNNCGGKIAGEIAGAVPLKLIELGAGDGLKTKILIRHLHDMNIQLSFIPVDISENSNQNILKSVMEEFPSVSIEPVTSDYFRIAGKIKTSHGARQVILFLGSNIGNLNKRELNQFFGNISEILKPGDYLLTGFDLKKSPSIILNAYDDPGGVTARFNLNLLERLNREIGTDFDISLFEHHTSYDPVSGEVKSYLVSTTDQIIFSRELGTVFSFIKWEPVFMEMSKKFDIEEIYALAAEYGFSVINNYSDHRNFFTDSLWVKV